MEKLLNLLVSVNPYHDIETYRNSKDLYGEGLIDSLGILMILDEINAEYDIEIGAIDYSRQDFANVESLLAMIKKHSGR